jgi:hypothetical protein
MKLTLGILALMMILAVIPPALAGAQQGTSSPGAEEGKKAPEESSSDAVEYNNARYSFKFSLPQTWKGYSIVMEQWEASDAQKGAVERGPIISIRHPNWNKENPRQDIPILVFTLAQWDSAEKGDLYVNGSARSFLELGRNRKYAFAVSTRYNEAEVVGREEVDKILQHEPLHPLWTK